MKKSHLFWCLALALIVFAFFLRVYRIPEYLTFLSDQGRDAIILKRIVTLEKWVFVGPTTSIGNVFTGPFFYYLVAPFMLLWRLDPAGPAYGIAIINTIGLILSFVFVYKNFSKTTSVIFLVLAGFSANQILQSRFSWNPNPVSTFSFLALACWYYSMKEGKMRWFVITGVIVGLCLQLHYMTVLLLLPMGIEVLITSFHLLRSKAHPHYGSLIHYFRKISVAIISGVFTFIPLILFDVKNHFINLKTLLRATSTGEIQAKNIAYLDRFNDSLRSMWHHALGVDWSTDLSLLLLVGLTVVVCLIAFTQYRDTRRRFLLGCVLLVASFIPLFALLETGRHVHYYNHLYLALYALMSLVGTWIIDLIIKRVPHNKAPRTIAHVFLYGILGFCLFAYARSHISTLIYLTEPHRQYTQIGDAQTVAQYIIGQQPAEAYQVVGLPYYETEGHYRYFLEYYNRRPMTADTLGDPTELYVICHEETIKACQIPGNPQWQLADFQNRHPEWKTVSEKKVTNVWVVKIIK
ncbi:MAG: glycosyltransferase family 39 protein [Candidatus Roizmanbacteria bacterium]